MLKQPSNVNLFGAFQLSDEDTHRRAEFIGAIRARLAGQDHPERCDGMCRRNPFVLLPICSALVDETVKEGESTSRSESVSGHALEERRRDILSWIDDLQPFDYDFEHPLEGGKGDTSANGRHGNFHATGSMGGRRKEGEEDCFDDSDYYEPYCHCSTNPFRNHAPRMPHASTNAQDDRYDSNSKFNSNYDSRLWPPPPQTTDPYHGYHALPTAECCCDNWQANTAKHGQQDDIVIPQPRSWTSTREQKALLDYRAPSTRIIKSHNPFNPFVKRMMEDQRK
ncbi:hypothetical protein L218DRAFT_963210 [Marasmius fiardii PR-910]|nr:hypothetical protein L218DRAFT_963210 [Marasmius fiardii PR-910]